MSPGSLSFIFNRVFLSFQRQLAMRYLDIPQFGTHRGGKKVPNWQWQLTSLEKWENALLAITFMVILPSFNVIELVFFYTWRCGATLKLFFSLFFYTSGMKWSENEVLCQEAQSFTERLSAALRMSASAGKTWLMCIPCCSLHCKCVASALYNYMWLAHSLHLIDKATVWEELPLSS